jgi:hypothetical protein
VFDGTVSAASISSSPRERFASALMILGSLSELLGSVELRAAPAAANFGDGTQTKTHQA